MPFSSVLGANSVVRPGVCTSATRPSVPYIGQLIFETDTSRLAVWTGSAWQYETAAAGPPGLVYVTGASFTTSSAVNVNNCFTSSHQNYGLVYELVGSTSLTISLRFRASGVDDSAASYNGGGNVTRLASGSSDLLNNGSTSFTVGLTSAGDASRRVRGEFAIYAPQLTVRTGISGTIASAGASSSEFGGGYYGGEFSATTSFDGFSLIASTGTITGTYRVYGYTDS